MDSIFSFYVQRKICNLKIEAQKEYSLNDKKYFSICFVSLFCQKNMF